MDHNDLISILVAHLSNYSFTDIRTDRADFTLPSAISWKKRDGSHIPDVTAKHNNTLFIFEIETCRSLEEEENRDRWRLFSNFARERRSFFAVVVPQICRAEAEKICKRFNVPADIWAID